MEEKCGILGQTILGIVNPPVDLYKFHKIGNLKIPGFSSKILFYLPFPPVHQTLHNIVVVVKN